MRASLDQRGFVVLREVADARRLAGLRAGLERCGQAPRSPGERSERGTRHVRGLLACDAHFADVVCEPRVLACVQHVLGRPARLMYLAGREPAPGFGAQGLHADWLPRAAGEPFAVVTALWMLDDFTVDNGATRVLPGSHAYTRAVPRELAAPERGHPGETVIEAAAGSVLVFNGHLWHRGAANTSRDTRRSLQVQYVAAERLPPGAEREPVPSGASARLLELLG